LTIHPRAFVPAAANGTVRQQSSARIFFLQVMFSVHLCPQASLHEAHTA
jgi:hypothetical protein